MVSALLADRIGACCQLQLQLHMLESEASEYVTEEVINGSSIPRKLKSTHGQCSQRAR